MSSVQNIQLAASYQLVTFTSFNEKLSQLQVISVANLSIKARNLCLCVCLSVYVCLKYLCRTGSDWSESFSMAAAWFKGVQRRICLDYNDTINKLFHKCFTNLLALSKISTIATCAPEPITAELKPTTYLKKQADLYLHCCELDRDFAGGSVPFCASKLTVVD